jgi:CubicO group peptidase (beta-lactamase class C family)
MAPAQAASADRYAAIDAVLDAARERGETGFALKVADRQGRVLYERNVGDFDATRRVPVASASKMATGLLMLTLVDRGELQWRSTTGEVLGWTGPAGAITLAQLLGQVSGLPPDHACLNNAATTLAACVQAIAAGTLRQPPGAQFDYGGSVFSVAARMAEVATGKSWNQLFAERITQPLGLPPQVTFHATPWLGGTGLPATNPRPAGGLVASMDDYLALMRVVLQRGTPGVPFAHPALFDDMASEPQPEAAMGHSPLLMATGKPYRYGMGTWLECLPARRPCPLQSSLGAFGFLPWLDSQAGYSAVLGMARPLAGGNARRTLAFAAQTQQQLAPLIAQALAVPISPEVRP